MLAGTQESWPGHSLILCGYLVGHSSISKAGAAGTIQTWRHQTPSYGSHPELSRCEPGYGNSYPEHHPHIPLNPRREAGCLEEAEPRVTSHPNTSVLSAPGGGLSTAPPRDPKQLAEGSPARSLITSHLDLEPQEFRPKSVLSGSGPPH